MNPKTQQEIAGRGFPMRDAVLRGYHRYCVKGGSYPAIAACGYSFTRGKLLLELTEQAISAFDEYEGTERDLYQRIVVQVETDTGEFIRSYAVDSNTVL
jgi:Gamma-glutamyl cyclotransferase, AIG2-like